MTNIHARPVVWLATAFAMVALFASWTSADPPSAGKPSKIPFLKLGAKALARAGEVETVIQMLDEATRRDYAAISKVLEVGFEARTRIQIGESQTLVESEKLQDGWRGGISVKIQMPASATVALDMDALWESMYFNPSTRTIELSLPPLKIVSVETFPNKASVSADYPGLLRCSFWDSSTAIELERDLLKSTDWGHLASAQKQLGRLAQ